MPSKKIALSFLLGVAAAIIAAGLFLNPIPQPASYHQFADQRAWMGIPNAWNVLSNIPLALVGLWGLFLLFSPGRVRFNDPRESWLWTGVALGLILTAIGSSSYHLAPSNASLVWDRLPMTIVFASLIAALASERISVPFGLWLWPLMLGIGFYSVFAWRASEARALGDLRFYLEVQALTLSVIFMALLARGPYDKRWALALLLLFYGLAIFFEQYDHQIFNVSHGTVSGHPLKHLAAALAGASLFWMIWKRKKIGEQ